MTITRSRFIPYVFQPLYRALRGKGFLLEKRGEVEIKGKGLMITHFVNGRSNMAGNDVSDVDTEDVPSQSDEGKSEILEF